MYLLSSAIILLCLMVNFVRVIISRDPIVKRKKTMVQFLKCLLLYVALIDCHLTIIKELRNFHQREVVIMARFIFLPSKMLGGD